MRQVCRDRLAHCGLQCGGWLVVQSLVYADRGGESWSDGARSRGAGEADSCGKSWAFCCGVQQVVPCTVGAKVLKQKAQVSPGLGLLGYATGWAVYRIGWCARQGE